MLDQRKTKLLRLIIEKYIKTARPVGSKILANALKCSSATVRSEMAELEDDGLIEKTHISSGRVPSEKGYRYYVDNIMEPHKLSGTDMLKLQTLFHNKTMIVSDVIIKSMEIVSELTNYTTVVLGNASKNNLVTKVEVVPIDSKSLVAIVITDKGHIEHKNISFGQDVAVEEIKKTVDLINKLIIGTPIDDVSTTLEYQVKPVIGNYVKQHEVLYNAFYNAFNDMKYDNVKVNNTRNILMQPEFDNIERIREIISKFEDKDMVECIKEEGNGVNIYIGSENKFDDDVTIIKTKYVLNGEEGTIALVGPKRMDYDRVIALLNYIKENINDEN